MPGRERCGAALPATLFALLAIGVLAASGFLFAFLESRAAANHAASVQAFYVAEAGLSRALAATAGDTASRSVTLHQVDGGVARVESRRLIRLDGPRELRVVVSEGTHDPGREGPAQRSVAQVVLAPRPFDPPAALLAADTVRLKAGDRVSGKDPSVGSCPGVPELVAGLAVRPGRFVGDTVSIDGTPALLETAEIEAALRRSGLDARNALRREFIQPEWLIVDRWPGEPLAEGAGSTAAFADAAAPPITGTVAGAGVLVMAGDLTVAGELSWEGLVLVGGSAEVTGRLEVRGMVVVGLGVPEGEAAGRSAGSLTGSGRVIVQYDACAAAGAAARAARGTIRRPGGWYEVF